MALLLGEVPPVKCLIADSVQNLYGTSIANGDKSIRYLTEGRNKNLYLQFHSCLNHTYQTYKDVHRFKDLSKNEAQHCANVGPGIPR